MTWLFLKEWGLKRKRKKAYAAAQQDKEKADKAAEQENEKLQQLLKSHSDSDPAVFNQKMVYLEALKKCSAATLALAELRGKAVHELASPTLEALQKQADDLRKKMDDLRASGPRYKSK